MSYQFYCRYCRQSSYRELLLIAGKLSARFALILVLALFHHVGRTKADELANLMIHPIVADKRVQPISAEGQKLINKSVDAGVEYLKSTQHASGTWIIGESRHVRLYATGFSALPALALLESGVAARHQVIQKAARFVRAQAPTIRRTYDLSLAILFLDKLAEPRNRPIIRSLALRLAAGQTELGGWSYYCPILSLSQEQKALRQLGRWTTRNNLKPLRPSSYQTLRIQGKRKLVPKDGADNSNTQFAVLALWVARKHGLLLEYPIARVEQRFRTSQHPRGWVYHWHGEGRPYGSMTAAGLLALATGRAAALQATKPLKGPRAQKVHDQAIATGLRSLGAFMNDPTDKGGFGPKRTLNVYFLWSVERTAVFCNLQTIGGRDWYRWGVNLLLRTQRPDGSWLAGGNKVGPVIDTSMALLFLSRSDLLPDLRKTLKKAPQNHRPRSRRPQARHRQEKRR